jgi:hypothetical protein
MFVRTQLLNVAGEFIFSTTFPSNKEFPFILFLLPSLMYICGYSVDKRGLVVFRYLWHRFLTRRPMQIIISAHHRQTLNIRTILALPIF